VDRPCRMPLSSAVWLMPCCTSHLPDLMCLLRFSGCACTCMTLVSIIWWPSSSSYATCMALSSWDFFADHPLPSSSSTMRLIGLFVLIHASPPQAMRCFLGTTYSLGHRIVRTLSPAQVLRQSTTLLLMAWLRLVGCARYFKSFTVFCVGAHLSTATISASSTSPPTLSSTSAQSTLRLISTSLVRRSPSVRSASSTFLQRHISWLSSQKGYHPHCFRSLGLVSTSVVVRVSTTRGVKIIIVCIMCRSARSYPM
jgi:hypothetical protein